MKAVLLVVASLIISCSGQGCPPNWRQSGFDPTKCYLVVSTKKIWFDAGVYCAQQSQGAVLTSVSSAFENNNVIAIVKDTAPADACPRIWLGGNDFDQKGQYKWVDGKPFTYANWKSDQPDPKNRCVSLTPDPSGKWRTEDCGTESCFVCEMYTSSWASTTNWPYSTTNWPYSSTNWPYSTTNWPHTSTQGWPYTSTQGWPYTSTQGWPYTSTQGWPYTSTQGWPYTSTQGWPYTSTQGWPTASTDGWPYSSTTGWNWGDTTTPGWNWGSTTTSGWGRCVFLQNIAIMYDTSETEGNPSSSTLLKDTANYLKSAFIGSWHIDASGANVIPIPYPNTDQHNAAGGMGAINEMGFKAGQSKEAVIGFFDSQSNALTQRLVNPSAVSDIQGGLDFVQTKLINNANNRPNVINTVIILSASTSGVNSASATATALKNSGVTVITVAVGTTTDQNTLGQLATSPSHSFSLPNPADPAASMNTAYGVYAALLNIPNGVTGAGCPSAK